MSRQHKIKADSKTHIIEIDFIRYKYRARKCRPEEQCSKCLLRNHDLACRMAVCDADGREDGTNVIVFHFQKIYEHKQKTRKETESELTQ